MSRFYYILVLCVVGCAPGPPPKVPANVAPLPEDEVAARAAELAGRCELTAAYLGAGSPRAKVSAEEGRVEALEAMRRVPDRFRGGAFARAFGALDMAARALAGAGEYTPPLSASDRDRLCRELLAAADELKSVGGDYLEKLAGRYEPRGTRPKVIWGPLPPRREGARAETFPEKVTASAESAASAVTPTTAETSPRPDSP